MIQHLHRVLCANRPRRPACRPGVERLETRVQPAHLEVFLAGAGAVATAGDRTDGPHDVRLGETNLVRDLYSNPLALAETGPPKAHAAVGFNYTSTGTLKSLGMDGSVWTVNGPVASVQFGTTNQASELGHYIDLTIVPDTAGEAPGEPIDVTVGARVSWRVFGGGQAHYDVRYMNEKDGPFEKTVLAGQVTTDGTDLAGNDVRFEAAIGKTIQVYLRGDATAPPPAGSVDLGINVTAYLWPAKGTTQPDTTGTGTTSGTGGTPTTDSGTGANAGSGGSTTTQPTPTPVPRVPLAVQANDLRRRLLALERRLLLADALRGSDAEIRPGVRNFDRTTWFWQRDRWIARVQRAKTPHVLGQLALQLERAIDRSSFDRTWKGRETAWQRAAAQAATSATLAPLLGELQAHVRRPQL